MPRRSFSVPLSFGYYRPSVVFALKPSLSIEFPSDWQISHFECDVFGGIGDAFDGGTCAVHQLLIKSFNQRPVLCLSRRFILASAMLSRRRCCRRFQSD